MTSYKYVLYDKQDHLAYVTLNRPEVLNAISPPVSDELFQIFTDIIEDSNIWVAILTGAGDRAFSAGADIKWMVQHPEYPRPRTPGFVGFVRRAIWKPIIAAVHGYCLGGGLEHALHCDLIIAADNAQIGLPEINRGWPPGGGGTLRLPRQIPMKVAMWMLLTGDPISAEEAHRVGLVNKVVPRADLMAEATRVARRLCENSPVAVQALKEITLRAQEMPLNFPPLAWDLQQESPMSRVRTSEDYQEGRRAFVEKRRPVFKGR